MKRKDEDRGDHIVPLPRYLLADLKEWRRIDGESAVYVCPAPKGLDQSRERLWKNSIGADWDLVANIHPIHGGPSFRLGAEKPGRMET
ncbi:MAG: hypothetical protein IPG84_16835 [Betaproteobacteria bacterium]|nr:hypothetical protein [Betaproteobacteria bacterium]